jgi:CubicO group peptidase (beta-lactamase class C family)
MRILYSIILLSVMLMFCSCDSLLLNNDSDNPFPPVPHNSVMADFLDSLRYSLKFPALSAAIVSDTGIIEAQSAGSRRYGGELNVKTDDIFQLGSCSKALTAVLAATLVDEGLLTWNTTLAEVFPEYASVMREEYKSVTVKQLLSHSAGFRRDPDVEYHSDVPMTNRSQMLQKVFIQEPAGAKGEYLYSNLGYIIAAAVMEKVTDISYEQLMHDRVFVPLNLNSAGFGPVGTVGKEDQPLQHTPNHAVVLPTSDAQLNPVYNPAGGISMSVIDWSRYIQWVLKAKAGEPQNLLKPGTVKMLTTAAVTVSPGISYAMGWMIVPGDEAGMTLQHSGSNGFNYATAWLAPDKHYAIIIMCNQGPVGGEWPLEPVFRRLYRYYNSGRAH